MKHAKTVFRSAPPPSDTTFLINAMDLNGATAGDNSIMIGRVQRK
jgi:hypothetical protein